MSLIVEDGTGVTGANSYISLVDARGWLSARGKPLTGDDVVDEALLLSAMDWLEAKRDLFQGGKTSPGQALQWPRAGVVIDSISLASDKIPDELRWAQALLAFEAKSSELFVNRSGERILSEKVDVIEVHYRANSSTRAQPYFGAVEAFLRPLYKASSGLPVKRV